MKCSCLSLTLAAAALAVAISGCRSQAVRCGVTIEDGPGDSKTTPCLTTTTRSVRTSRPDSHEEDYEDEEFAMFSRSSTYLVLIIAGIVALPATLILRMCWTRRFNQRRMEAVNEFRHSHTGNRGRQDIFSIDINDMDFPVIPTYEESMSNPGTGSPPAYDDLPPCYADIVKEKKSKYMTDPQPSTSTAGS